MKSPGLQLAAQSLPTKLDEYISTYKDNDSNYLFIFNLK